MSDTAPLPPPFMVPPDLPAPAPEPPPPPHRMVNGRMVLLTDKEIAARAAEDAAFVAPARRWEVPQLLVLRRLIAAGKLRAAIAGLKMEAPAGSLTDGELALREMWKAAAAINSDDADAIAFFRAIGADPAEILAHP